MNAITKSYWCATRHPVQWRKSKLLVNAIKTAYITSGNTSTFTDYRPTESMFLMLSAYINRLLQYDYFKATDIKGGIIKTYITDIDTILTRKMGICLDFAVLLCAMCRACGIPCKVVYGYATTYGVRQYHAWVSAYYDGGWHDYDPTYIKLGVKNVTYERKAVR